MNEGQVQSDVNAARAQGNARQADLNQQSVQAKGQYQQAYGQEQGAASELQDYTRKIAGLNYGNIYGQDLSNAQSMYGFDPKSLALANKNLLQTQTAMQYAPQAAAQAGNYYGGTAGQAENAYQNMAGNINTTLANQSNAINQYQNLLSATQNQANQQTSQQLAGQAQALGGYEAVAQNYTNIANNASQTMTAIEKLQQDQGSVTADQITAYQNAYSNYVTAQAAASQAASAALTAKSTSAGQNIANLGSAGKALGTKVSAQQLANAANVSVEEAQAYLNNVAATTPKGTSSVKLTPNKTNTSKPAQIPTKQTGNATQFAPQNASQITDLIRQGIY